MFLAILVFAALVFGGCSTTENNTPKGGPGTDTVAQDLGGQPDAVAAPDGTSPDTLAAPDVPADVPKVEPDVAVVPDVPVTPDVVTPDDAKTGDTSTPTDVAPKSTKCTADSECKAAYGACLAASCNLTTGNCELNPVAEGTACSTAGNCGGAGVCKQGACNAPSNCGPQACTPTPIQCGAKIVIQMGDMSASKVKNYACSAVTWDGGEKIVSLSSDVTVVVVAELTGDVTPTSTILALPPQSAGSCLPGACDAAAPKLTFGIGPGITRVLVVDSIAGDSNTVTLTVTCSTPVLCGDGVCGEGESCGTCAKDCGSCAECGDGKCEAAYENCATCAGDCGACPKECVEGSVPGCAGCACEACVTQMDPFCKDSGWDSTCIAECTDKCGGPKCSELIKPFCGDGICDTVSNSESGTSCPNDCPTTSQCGDGVCNPDGESCSGCSLDCGICAAGAAIGCGDGTCNGKEHCGSCPQDCGVCGKLCVTKSGPTCNGCDCEAKVCAADSYCCKTAWDTSCVTACSKANGQKCPKVVCGDGVCSGTETCKSCKGDCGACPVKCGDAKCDAPTETAANCAADCGAGSCNGKCGSSQGQGTPACYCDSYCVENGDCCADIELFCP